MIWNILIIKRNDTKTVTIWWLGRSLFQEEGIQNVLIWWLGRGLLSREETLNTSSFDDLEKLIFKHKILNSFCDDDLEEEYFFKRKDTEIVMIRRLGRNLFPGEKKPKALWTDGLEEDYFQEKRYDNYYDLMIWRCLYSRENILKTLFIWWHGTGFFSRINLLKSLRSINSDYSYLPENWYKISYKLMIWKKLISRQVYSKRADLMTWKKPISREIYSKRADLMTWKRLVFKRRDTKYVLIWWFGEAYIQ